MRLSGGTRPIAQLNLADATACRLCPLNVIVSSATAPLASSTPFDFRCQLPSFCNHCFFLFFSLQIRWMHGAQDMTTDANLDDEDLKKRILQSTLQEVAARDDGDTDCCVICLEAIDDPCETVPCGHRNFDYVCALSWFLDHPSCPLCKSTVTTLLRGPADRPNREATAIKQKPEAQPKTQSSRERFEPRGSFRNRRHERLRQHRRTEHHGQVTLSQALERRRSVYREGLYSKHVGTNRVSRYQELSPALFCSDEELVSRARLWIRRELQVFSFLSLEESESTNDGPAPASTAPRTATERRRANNAEFLLEYIIAVLKSVDIMGSAGQAEDLISDFLGRDNTKLFLHELRAWLRSPFTKLEDWDRAVQYDSTGYGRGRSAAMADRPKPRGDFYRPGGRRLERHRHRREPYHTGDRRGGRNT